MDVANSSTNNNQSHLIPNEEKTPDSSVLSGGIGGIVLEDESVPVGITIAYKRQQSGFHETMTPSRSGYRTPPYHQSTEGDQQSLSKNNKSKKKNRSFQVFVECGIVYAVCMILPTIAGCFYDWYALVRYQQKTGTRGDDASSLYSYVSQQLIPEEWWEPSYWCSSPGVASSSSWSTSSLLSSSGVCSALFRVTSRSTPSSVMSDDVTAWSDTFTISFFALLLAAIRIAIIHFTVPSDDDDNDDTTAKLLNTMIRCKSAHLLSADYVVTPVATPRPSIRTIDGIANATNISLPYLQSSAITEPPTLLPQQRPLGSSIASSHSIGTGAPRTTSTTTTTTTSSSAAPRYATALFRSCYTAAAAVLAYALFHDANFWPWYAGGSGRTAHCWDLSGNVAVWGIDSDFDHHNVALKHYFLWQASYHYHSAVFYGVGRISVWWTQSAAATTMNEPAGASLRRLLQHFLAILLIGIAYLFSSLRRLCAVGLFAFDVSSFFLHLLQVCINAPDGSPWRQRRRVAGVVWLCVMPSFLITRFGIWPLLWYSATVESTTWLRQLDTTVWVGSATVLRTAVHGLMVGIEVLSVVYLTRLSSHSHLQRVLGKPDKRTDAPPSSFEESHLARQLFQGDEASSLLLPSQ